MLLPKTIAPVRVISRKPADRDRREGWQAAKAAYQSSRQPQPGGGAS